MIRIVAYIRPHKLEQVKSAIAATGVTGMNVAEVRGAGNSEERPSMFAADPALVALPIRSRIETIVSDDLAEAVVAAIEENARTGEAGDGKIFVEPIADAIRVRTSERGDDAI